MENEDVCDEFVEMYEEPIETSYEDECGDYCETIVSNIYNSLGM